MKDIADGLGTAPYRVRIWIRAGKLKATSLGADSTGYRVTPEDLEAFLKTKPLLLERLATPSPEPLHAWSTRRRVA